MKLSKQTKETAGKVATLGLAGAQFALLMALNFSKSRRRSLGWPMLLLGAVPIVVDAARKVRAT